jgi:hypothetical protein
MKVKNQAKEKQIMMMTQLESGETLTWENLYHGQKIIRAGIDNGYQYIIQANYRFEDYTLNAIVKDDQALIDVLLDLTNKCFNYHVSKIRRRKRKFNQASIS